MKTCLTPLGTESSSYRTNTSGLSNIPTNLDDKSNRPMLVLILLDAIISFLKHPLLLNLVDFSFPPTQKIKSPLLALSLNIYLTTEFYPRLSLFL